MKLSELAEKLGLELRGDGAVEIDAPAPLEQAGPGSVVFVAGPKFLEALRATRASCAIVPARYAGQAPCAVLVSERPYVDFARVLELFFPPWRPAPGVDPTARVADDAVIGDGSWVGPYAVIGAGARIGRRAVIHPHATIYAAVSAGDDFVCHSHVSIRERVRIGNRVTILNGAVIGADGFGFTEQGAELVKIPQVGTVVIEDDVEIGANATIDRATMGATVIGRGVRLDNLVHIGHNCVVGEYSRFAAQVGLAGSVRVGKWCQFGGQSGFADHAMVGDRARVAAQSGVHHGVAGEATVGGTPAVDIRLWRRMVAALARLPELMQRLRAIEARLGNAQPR